MKRIISLAILLVMVLSILPLNAFAASPTGEKFWLEGTTLYWNNKDGVKYDIEFYRNYGDVRASHVYTKLSSGKFDLSKRALDSIYAVIYEHGTREDVAHLNNNKGNFILSIVVDVAQVKFKEKIDNSTYLYEWTDLGAKRYKVTYGYSYTMNLRIHTVEETLIVENGATSAEIPSLNNRVQDVYVTPLDGLYAGQVVTREVSMYALNFTDIGRTSHLVLTDTNCFRFNVTTNNEKYSVSWKEIEGVTEYRFSYKKSTDSKYTVLKPQTKLYAGLPYAEDDTVLIYLEAKIDGEWQWIGSRTVNGDTLLGDTPETYANGTSKTNTSSKITGLKAEAAGNGLVKLTWNSVENAENYKVYYRKVGASKWSGGTGSFLRTKASLSVRFKGSSEYEIKIVSGKKESGILIIKPSAKKGTVWTKTK